ncbi:TonB-dependent hemoglobin/transferrin/lactoferrin family receptor [Photobacterium kishitanii]|uniref:TonB-dependent hemoglobin/transferrin/lactoferrin family receptor n=1 Tax=Photobacterium kishitanii TaxID=318456 RepID=UPI00071AED9D|nr:TonB-dependent hemoglobin/transferrin/lactoferrin family receptor [Photobacterium kishitanii]
MKKTVIAVAISTLCGNVYAETNNNITEFSEVLVTAQKIEKTPYEVNGSVTVVTEQDMRQQGATELYDALKNVAGVSVSGGAGRPQNITIRGVRGNRIKIISDDVETGDGYGATDLNDKVGRNSFDLTEAKQIEVVKGGGSSLYGSGALGGMVIVTTKDASDYLTPMKDTAVEVSTNYVGESNKYQGTVNIAQRIGDSEHLLRYSQWRGNGSDNYDHAIYNRDIDGFNISLSSDFYIGDHQQISTKLSRYQDSMIRNEQLGFLTNEYNEKNDTTTDKYQLTYLYNDAGMMLFDDAKVIGYYANTNSDRKKHYYEHKKNRNITEHYYYANRGEFNEQKYGLKTQFQRKLERHNIVWGVDTAYKNHRRIMDKRVDFNGHSSLERSHPFADANTYEMGFYIHDDINWNDWEFGAGLRYDYQLMQPQNKSQFVNVGLNGLSTLDDMTSDALSPSLSVAYNFNQDLKAYLSYNRGFNAPNYAKVYGYVPHDGIPPFDILPNYNLEAETSDNFELGFKARQGIYTLNAAVFYSKYNNFISPHNDRFNEDNGRMEVRYINVDKVTSYGFELSTSAELTETLTASADFSVVTAKDDESNYISTSSPWEGGLTLDYSQDFDAFVRWNFAAAMNKVPQCGDSVDPLSCSRTSGWGTVDLGFSYEPINNLSVNANINNILNHEYIRYQDVAGLSEYNNRYNTEAGRNFNVSMSYKF